MTSAVGYQPSLSTEMGSFQERILATYMGSITSIQAIYVFQYVAKMKVQVGVQRVL